jgi:thiosulfate reductase cytochrome b subunit
MEEIDCFLCHMPDPNNAARIETLKKGDFQWANTATLLGSNLVSADANGDLTWNPEAFDENSNLLPGNVTIQSPSNANCAQCHGLIHSDKQPLTLSDCSLDNPQTAVTGQVISGDKISESGVNLENKQNLSQAWDVHAERQVNCVDCHYSLNNPIAYQESAATRPDSLLFDPRHLDFGEYLKYPDHNIARGQSAQTNVSPELKGTMRRCDSCHASESIHSDWLPYTEKHLAIVACESCHIPQMYAPAIQSYDWTVLTEESSAASICRGVENNGGSVSALVTGFQPVLMMRQNVDGDTLLSPYNLVTAWYWVYEDANGSARPVRLVDLRSVYFEKDTYAPEIMAAFDYNGDTHISDTELRIDTAEKQNLISSRLQALGLNAPRITADVQPYSINHGVVTGSAALSDCRACHTENSRLSQGMILADYIPGDVMPEFVTGTNVTTSGSFAKVDRALLYQPEPAADDLYIFGHSSFGWVDWLGGLFFLAVLLGVSAHGGLRIVKSSRSKKTTHAAERIYMYHSYERFWHWLQTALIVILLLTGLVIHRPDLFGGLSFHGLVTIHNVSAAILAINAFLSLFYHLTTGEIRNFIPRPYGFFDDAIVQTKYYLRGIFKREPHPFEKSPERKMNPLQQVTYLGILNVLLPLQGITGILMWGVQKWPRVATFLGGLPNLAAFHTLVAWFFAAFIVAHVYLTTTGGTRALDSIKAMVTGWEDVEIHTQEGSDQEGSDQIESQDSEEK